MTGPGSDHARIEEIMSEFYDREAEVDHLTAAREIATALAVAESELAGARERTRRLEKRLRDLLNGIAIEFDDARLDYVVAQIDRDDLRLASEVLAPLREEDGTRDGMPITVTLEDLAAEEDEALCHVDLSEAAS